MLYYIIDINAIKDIYSPNDKPLEITSKEIIQNECISLDQINNILKICKSDIESNKDTLPDNFKNEWICSQQDVVNYINTEIEYCNNFEAHAYLGQLKSELLEHDKNIIELYLNNYCDRQGEPPSEINYSNINDMIKYYKNFKDKPGDIIEAIINYYLDVTKKEHETRARYKEGINTEGINTECMGVLKENCCWGNYIKNLISMDSEAQIDEDEACSYIYRGIDTGVYYK